MFGDRNKKSRFRPVRQRAVLALAFAFAALALCPALVRAQATKPKAGVKKPVGKDDKKKSAPGSKISLDPELQKKMEDVLGAEKTREAVRLAEQLRAQRNQKRSSTSKDKAASTPRRGGSQTVRTPAVSRSTRRGTTAPGASASLQLDISPVENAASPEQRTYMFSIVDGTYEQLVQGFARQTGLGVIGEAPKDGKISFVSTQQLSFREALSRIRMLLFNYKPHEPYWIEREGTHLKVSRINDLIRKLGPDRMFQSIDAFLASGLPDDELALVIHTPTGSVSDLTLVRDHLEDYVRLAQLGNTNSVTVFALVRDIHKYLELVDFFRPGGKNDPRTIEVIAVRHITPTEAIDKLGQLMELGGGSTRSRPRVTSRGKDANPLGVLPEPKTSILPDDARGVLIVRAMQDKIRDIREMLPYVDQPLAAELPTPVVIQVSYADPNELINTIREIMSAAPGSSTLAKPKPKRAVRGGATAASATKVGSKGITLIRHRSQDAIIVIGDEDGVKQVRELIAQFDVPDSAPVRLAVHHADASELLALLLQLMGTPVGGKSTIPGAPYKLVPDPADDAIWFTGGTRHLSRVRELLKTLDVETEEIQLHIVVIKFAKASFVASVLRDMDPGGGGGLPAVLGSKKGRGSRPKPGGASKFTPDDEQGLLYVLCTQSEWLHYQDLIDQLDRDLDDSPSYIRIDLEHVDPREAVLMLSQILEPTDPRKAKVRLSAGDGCVYVFGADANIIADLRAFVPQVDVPKEIVERVFEIRYADPAQIKVAIETLVGRPATVDNKSRGRAVAGGTRAGVLVTDTLDLTILALGSRLLIKTTPEKMVEVASVVERFDIPDVGRETRVYDFEPGTDLSSLVDSLLAAIGGSPAGGVRAKGRVRGSSPDGPRFLPFSNSGKLVVMASPEQFEQIESLIELLRDDLAVKSATEVAFIDVEFADVEEVVQQITPLLEMRLQEQGNPGELSISSAAAKARRPGSKGVTGGFHLAADLRSSRIVLAAPPALIEYARELVASFDLQAEASDDVIFRTVRLNHSTGAEMVKAIREMLGGKVAPSTRRTPPKPGKATGAPAPAVMTVVEAPGGGAVVLHGPREDVEEAIEWIDHLDGISSSGRAIKVYELANANVKRLGEFIMAVVGQQSQRPGISQVKRQPRRSALDAQGDEEEEFETTKTWRGHELYMQADMIARTLIVATTETNMVRIDEIIEDLDSEEGKLREIGQDNVPKRVYVLKHADAWEAAFELDMVLDQLYSGPEKPQVESALFGNALIVRCMDESRFDEIGELIEQYVDVVPIDEARIISVSILAPGGMKPSQVADWLRLNHPELDITIVDETSEEDASHGMEILRPVAVSGGGRPCVLPSAFLAMVDNVGTSALTQVKTAPSVAKTDPSAPEKPTPKRKDDAATSDLLQEAIQGLVDGKSNIAGSEGSKNSKRLDQGQKITIRIDNQTGKLILEGPKGLLEDTDDWMDDLTKELDKFGRPDIRVVRVRYIDVYSAAQILEDMFNATRQQRAAVAGAARRAQQQAQAQRRQQQQRQAQGQGDGQRGGRSQRGQPQQATPQAQVPQLPPTSVRITPNARDRTLILRADTNQFPIIFELLATIDRPKPIDSELRVFSLDKLNATEVEELLRKMLNLDAQSSRRAAAPAAGQRGRAGARAATPTSRGGGSGSLPRTIMQETITGSMLGIDPGDIKISSNESANAIIAVAPTVALDFIGELIKKLESQGVPERQTRYFELTHADASEVANHLKAQFEEEAAGRGGESSKGKSNLNTPSFIAYTKLNMVTVLATEEQMGRVEELLIKLDVEDASDEWKDVALVHTDSGKAAATLEKMFGGTGGSSSGASRVRFIGEEGGRMLLYQAPEGLVPQILTAVQNLEDEASVRNRLRTITLEHATPSKIAEAVEAAYGSRGRGRQRSSQFSITAHDPSRTLFVMADDGLFEKIQSLTKTLDQPRKIDIEFRIYPLQYADAKRTHELMTKLMREYMQRLGSAARDMDAFSVEVDERANALVVLGTPAIFGFLEESLARVDNPANAASPEGYIMIFLENADANEVAQNINRMWANKKKGAGDVQVRAEANRSLNMLIVRGPQDQLEEIQKEFLDPLKENTPPPMETETISLQYAQPEAVAESIIQIFKDRKVALQSIGRDKVSKFDYTVSITPDINTRQIIVQATEKNMEFIKARVAELDQEDIAASSATKMKIYPVKYADPNAVVNIINNWSRAQSQSGGRARKVAARDVVNAVAEHATQSVVVTASESNHLIIAELIDGLDVAPEFQKETHVHKLMHADAEELSRSLQIVYRALPSRRRGDKPVQIAPDTATNSLLITANQTEMEALTKLIESLDVEPDLERGNQIKTISLAYADPYSVVDSITQLFRGRGRRPNEQVIAVPDGGSRSVIVSASATNMARVEGLIAQLDTEEGGHQTVHVVQLDNADPASVARALTEIYIRSMPRGRGNQAPPISVSALQGSKAILVKAGAEDFANMQATIEELDREDAVLNEEVRVVSLLYADASEVHTAMTEYLRKPGGAGRGKDLAGGMRLSVLSQSNAIVVSGEKDAVKNIEQLVKQFDSAAKGGSEPQILSLTHADVSQIIPTLEQMFAEQRGGRRGKQSPIFSSNNALNAIIVKADRTDLTAIRSIVKQLDTEEAAAAPSFHLISIASGINVTDLAIKVEDAVNAGARAAGGGSRGGGRRGRGSVASITITPDMRTSSLIVSGDASLFDDAEELATMLVAMGPTDKSLRIIPLGNARGDDVRRLIETLRGESSGRSGGVRRGGARGGSSRRGNTGNRSRRGGRRP